MPPKTDFNKVQQICCRLIADYSDSIPGSRLPSCRTARLRYNCTRKELEMALSQLEQTGKITILNRKGIFWKSPSPATFRVGMLRTDWPQEYSTCLEETLRNQFKSQPDISLELKLLPVEPLVEDYLRILQSRTLDLAIITCNFTHFNQQEAGRLLVESPIPLIFLENHISCRAVNAISSKPEFSGMLAADYLLRRGHRKIALVNGERLERDTCLERELDGFTDYLSLHGIVPEMIDCRHFSQVSSLSSVEDKARSYIEKHGIHFTAAFVTSVEVAKGFYTVLRACNCSIPEDVSIIANSEVPSADRLEPPLTTVARDFSGYAKAAVHMIELLRNGKQPGIIQVPSYIVERKSVMDISKKGNP